MVSLFSRLAFSLATPTQPTTTRGCSSRLPRPVSPSSSLLLAYVSVSLSFHILAVAHTWRAYVYVYVCAPARSPLSLPSSSLFRGICTVSHKRFIPVVVYKFFLPPVFTFSMHLEFFFRKNEFLLSFFVCPFFIIVLLTLRF